MEKTRALIDEKRSVGQLAASHPHLIPLLEDEGIDYYCRGNRSLKEACEAVGLEPGEVAKALAAVPADPLAPQWMSIPLSDVTNHLISGHHADARKVVPRLQILADEVCKLHGQKHPELKRVCTLFRSISDELLHHIQGEETMLFPQVEALERAALEGTEPQAPYVGGLSHRILVEYHEHDLVAERMRKLRELASNFQVPETCDKYREFYAALESFEETLHDHMHLENNVLFPRAGVLESNVKLHVAGPW